MPIQVTRNKNGFTVAKVHYSCDPDKATPEWIAAMKSGMPEWAWRKEYEMDPYAMSGEPAIPELPQWRSRLFLPIHKVVKDGVIPDWWPRYAGFDWGRVNPSAFVLSAVDPDGRVIVYWELYRSGLKPQEIHEIVSSHPDWHKIRWIACDPSMKAIMTYAPERAGEERNLIDLFIEMGWTIVEGQAGGDVAFVQHLYKGWADPDKPKMVITQSCPKLWWELENLRHKELTQTRLNIFNQPEQLVDKDNHCWDALKYMFQMRPFAPDREEIKKGMSKEQMAHLLPAQRSKFELEEWEYDPVMGDWA